MGCRPVTSRTGGVSAARFTMTTRGPRGLLSRRILSTVVSARRNRACAEVRRRSTAGGNDLVLRVVKSKSSSSSVPVGPQDVINRVLHGSDPCPPWVVVQGVAHPFGEVEDRLVG